MYIYSKQDNVRLIRERVTRTNDKFIFKTETRIGTKFMNSSFYYGTILWNGLSGEIQSSDNIFMFKIEIAKQYKIETD